MRTIPMPLRAAAASARLHAVPLPDPAPSLRASPAAPALVRIPPERAEAQALIARLREHLARKSGEGEGRAPQIRSRRRADAQPWALGLAEVDRCLPAEGLAVAGLHDITPNAYGDFPAACGFALALAVRRLAEAQERRPVLWCRLETEQREYGYCFGHGVTGLGVPRARFLTLSLRHPVALLWTFEEALKSGCLSVVLGDVAVQYADLTATRRLALAGQAGKASGLAVLTRNYPGSTASVSRWCVATSRSTPVQSAQPETHAPGPPAWAVSLTRIRGGRPGSWLLNWQKDHASARFTLVPGFSGGALHPGAAEEAGPRAATQSALRAG
jgi:protein ImuA